MADEKGTPETPLTESAASPFNLRDTIRSCREYFDHVITTGRAHSPFSEEKVAAADDAVAEVVHGGYQGLKSIAVNGHPGVILTAAGIAAALPSIPFGARAIVRNAGLALVLASVMIYPDHLKPYFTDSAAGKKE